MYPSRIFSAQSTRWHRPGIFCRTVQHAELENQRLIQPRGQRMNWLELQYQLEYCQRQKLRERVWERSVFFLDYPELSHNRL